MKEIVITNLTHIFIQGTNYYLVRQNRLFNYNYVNNCEWDIPNLAAHRLVSEHILNMDLNQNMMCHVNTL